MNKKTLFITLLPSLLVASSFLPAAVSARTMMGIDDTTARPGLMMRAPGASASAGARMGIAATNADREIDRRITALNNLTTRINNMKRITADQKSTVLAQVQTAISDLTTLKVKIDADTDPATLKADKQSIVTSYRVFLLLIPKVEIMAHADLALQLTSNMTANDTLVQTKIQTAQDAGKNVDAINKLFDDRKAMIADAETQAGNAITAVSPLTPDGYPGNKPTLTSSRDSLKTARQDLNSAYQDLVKINQALNALK